MNGEHLYLKKRAASYVCVCALIHNRYSIPIVWDEIVSVFVDVYVREIEWNGMAWNVAQNGRFDRVCGVNAYMRWVELNEWHQRWEIASYLRILCLHAYARRPYECVCAMVQCGRYITLHCIAYTCLLSFDWGVCASCLRSIRCRVSCIRSHFTSSNEMIVCVPFMKICQECLSHKNRAETEVDSFFCKLLLSRSLVYIMCCTSWMPFVWLISR